MQALAILHGCDTGFTSARNNKKASADDLIDAVSSYFGLSPDIIKGSRRDKKTAYVRQIAMYLLREQTNARLAEIGRMLGGRNHSTIVHGCDKIAADLSTNQQTAKMLEEIKKSLQKT
jgi:chromosomal replication initiator protein